ncbi:MAG: hypothetical protein KAI44_08250 [Methylococcales bacterium]|nr:hypothetical protein [Methylococcales bacterium]MCK5478892.1 hypothetical protein [Methylococcales bacterium]
MNEQFKKNNRTIIIIFALSVIPFGIAWYLSGNTSWMGGVSTNNGKLITPPVTTEKTEFIGFDEFSIQNMKEIPGHWVLVNVIPNGDCNSVCQQAIHKTKQLRLMMNKDLTRIRRLVLIIPEINVDLAQRWWKDDARLLRSKPALSLVQKLQKIRNSDIPEGMLFLMDPLGNLMMQYEPDFDPYKVKSDLRKLLRISQIG